jgi:GT2 family glycosyltransferase
MTTQQLTDAAKARRSQGGPSVLVGIVTRNRANILPKSIQSALVQSYPNVRVIVFDNCSDDRTPELRSEFPNIEWYRAESHCGFVEARNYLMRSSQDDYYISLDDDAWFVGGDEIALAIEHLEKNPRVAAVGFDILTPDFPQSAPRSASYPVQMFIGCGHVIRLSSLRDVGLYTPSPGFYGSEEKDLSLRMLDSGWTVNLLPGVHVWHDRTSVARDAAAQHASGVCNDLVFALRRCPVPLILAVLPVKLFNHLRFAVRRRLVAPCLLGLWLFCRHGLMVLKSRQPVRAEAFREFVRLARRNTCAS